MNKSRHDWRPAAARSYLPQVLRILLLVLSGIPVVLPASAQDVVQRVTLERALEMFSQNSLELRIARAGVSTMSGLARQAAAYPNPGVEITHEPLSEGGETQSESYFNLRQRIEWPGVRSARTEAANRKVLGAVWEVKADSLRLVFEVTHVYIESVAAEERREALQSVIDIFREAERAIVARVGAGDASGYDVRRLRVERARYETELALADLSLHEIRRRLAILILPHGEGGEIGPAAPLSVPVTQLPIDEANLTARLHRPEIASMQERVESARASIGEARASRVPSPTLTAGYKRQSDGFRGPLLGVALPVPIFDRNGGFIEARRAELLAAETQLILVDREIINDVNRAHKTNASLASRVELLQDSLLADVGELLRTARIGYDEGEMSLVELMDAAKAYRDARIMVIDLSADYQSSHYDLLRAIGGRTPTMP